MKLISKRISKYVFFGKKTEVGISVNEELAQALHKSVIKKIQKSKIYARFKNNIWAAALPKMGSLFSFNCDVKYFLMCNRCFYKSCLG